jgi:hypothetical protein
LSDLCPEIIEKKIIKTYEEMNKTQGKPEIMRISMVKKSLSNVSFKVTEIENKDQWTDMMSLIIKRGENAENGPKKSTKKKNET